MSARAHRTLRWLAAAAWSAVIFGFSSIPGSNVPGRYGTLAHFVEYAVLGVLLYAALRIDLTPGRSALFAVVLASAYGASDEFHQSFVPMRVPDVRDWAVDTLGALTGATSAAWVERVLAARTQAGPSRRTP